MESTNEGAKTASFALGATTAEHSVPTHPDTTGEEDSDVTVAIQANADYTVGTSSSATVTVRDNDRPGSADQRHNHRGPPRRPGELDGAGQRRRLCDHRLPGRGGRHDRHHLLGFGHLAHTRQPGRRRLHHTGPRGERDGAWSNSTSATVGPATVTIAGDGDTFAGEGAGSEWGWVEFTLTTDRPVLLTSKPLNVSVLVSETEDMLPSSYEGVQTASFALNFCDHDLLLSPTTDTTQESDSVVTAAIQTSTDYTVGTPSSAR